MTKYIDNNRIERYTFNNHLVLTRIRSSFEVEKGSEISSYHLGAEQRIRILLILSGFLDITIDYITHRFEKDTIVEISPARTINQMEISDNLECFDLLVSRQFIEDTLLDKKPIPMSHFFDTVEFPGTLLSGKDAAITHNCLRYIRYYLKQEQHLFRKELLHHTFFILILELGNIYTKMEGSREAPRKATRKDNIIKDFINLMDLYAKKEHAPAFYADKLCISTQYLSLILKEKSGNTANTWIASYLITQAKTRLRTPGTTLQQISDELHFSDQASFGKFFKKHTGLSPKKYKEESF